ncbi:hypothetical protein B0H11DRAFT_2225116 [Mycena galericulata]|nr:hypothetical protein B0H11DRAFT_2225116 [Mycena galericulata]
MSLISDLNSDLNPPPTATSNICPECHNHALGAVKKCQGNGKNVQNWERHYQRCSACTYYLWHDPPTPLELTPDDVQVRFAAKASLAEAQQVNSKAAISCAAPNCRDSKGEPRRANIQCERTPFWCATCCKASGGCRSHRPAARDVSTRADTTLNSEYYNCCRATTHFYSSIEPQLRPADLEANTFYTAAWTKDALVPPEYYTLVADRQGKFVVGRCPPIAALALNGFISVLEPSPTPRWVNHDIRIPIPVNADLWILLKAPAVVDCFELELELSQLPVPVPSAPRSIPPSAPPSTPPSASAAPPTPDPTCNDLDVVLIDAPASSLAEPRPGNRFPLKYTCDMEQAFAALAAVKGESRRGIFAKHFPNLKYCQGTVYKHLLIYSDALKYNLMAKSSQHGRSAQGLWKELIRQIELKKASAAPHPAPRAPPGVVDLTEGRASAEIQTMVDAGMEDNTIFFDDDVAFTIVPMKMSHYMLTCWNAMLCRAKQAYRKN